MDGWTKIGEFGTKLDILANGNDRCLVNRFTGRIVSEYKLKRDWWVSHVR